MLHLPLRPTRVQGCRLPRPCAFRPADARLPASCTAGSAASVTPGGLFSASDVSTTRGLFSAGDAYPAAAAAAGRVVPPVYHPPLLHRHPCYVHPMVMQHTVGTLQP
jgi:hypothetical protein